MKQLLACLLLAVARLTQAAEIEHYTGICEASAAVALDAEHFAVADDEGNALMVYRVGKSAPARPPIALADFLATGNKASDLEAAARIGNVAYWLSSHSLTAAGKDREWRRRLFATRIDTAVSPPNLMPVGKPYLRLLDDLIAAPSLKSLKLAEAAALPPESPGGLNIEGLAATPDGKSLLIGFRNPLVAGKALLIPLRNPAQVVSGSAAASFGAPVLIDLGGRGIRSIDAIASSSHSRGYLIVAGPIGDAGGFTLFRWTGRATDAPVNTGQSLPDHFGPEALITLPGSHQILLLSDDGARCDAAAMKFQALRVRLK